MNSQISRPKVSICCSTYNHKKYVEQAIDSIMVQNYEPFEILIVDDESTDGTLDILRSQQRKWPHLIKVIERPHSGRVGSNLNCLLKISQGEYIMFLSLDDLLCSNVIERLVNEIQNNPQIQMVFSNQQLLIDQNSNYIKEEKILSNSPSLDSLLELEQKGGSFWLCSGLYRKSLIDAINGFDDDLIGDDIVLRVKILKYLSIHKDKSFTTIDYPVFKYRIHTENSSRNGERQFSILWEVNQRYFNGINTKTLNEWLMIAISTNLKKGNFFSAIKLIFFDKRNNSKFKNLISLILHILKKISPPPPPAILILFVKNILFFAIAIMHYFSFKFTFKFILLLLTIRANSNFLNQLLVALYFKKDPWPLILGTKELPNLFKNIENTENFLNEKLDVSDPFLLEYFPNIIFHSSNFDAKLAKKIYLMMNNLTAEKFEPLNKYFNKKDNYEFLKLTDQKEIANEIIPVTVNSENFFKFEDPKVFKSESNPLQHTLNIPDQFIARFNDIEIIDRFQIKKNNALILYDYSSDLRMFKAAGLHYNFLYIGVDNVIMFKPNLNKKDVLNLNEGILLSGRATENYFHWIIEYLPRLLNVELAHLPISIPILLKSELPKQFYEALSIIKGKRNAIMINPDKQKVFVKNLYVPSFHTYHPEDFVQPYWIGSVISPTHLSFIKNSFLNAVPVSEKKPSKKIYLARANTRNIVNAIEIENLLKRYGFETIRPERLTFKEQIILFNNASYVVSPAGAALSNLIFLKPTSKVICMVSERNKDYSMQSNLAKFAGADFVHLTGKSEKNRNDCNTEEEFVHSSFHISAKDLEDLLTQNGLSPISEKNIELNNKSY